MKRLNSGFTIIELLVIIALVSIVGLMSVSFYSRFITQNSVANASDQLTGSLRKAQIYSMMGKQNGIWGVAYNSSKIILFQGNTFATRNNAFDESFTLNANTTISGFAELTFARATGIPSSNPTITIAGNNNIKTVTINSQGVVSK